jgi:NitT/TauT family transport system substrate-binding protein
MTRLLGMIATIAIWTIALTTEGSAQTAKYHVNYVYGSAGYSYLDMYLAEDMGLLADEGVDFKTSVVAGSSPAAAGTIAGSFDFTYAVPISINRAIDQGQPLVHFALAMAQFGSVVVVSKEVAGKYNLGPDTPVENRVQALKGLRITTVGPNSGPDLMARFIAKREGWDPDRDLTLLPLSGPTAIAAFEQKRADAIIQSSPTADIAVSKLGGFKLLDINNGGYPPLKDLPGGSLVANKNWLANNKAAAVAVVRALWRAMDVLYTRTAEAKKVLRKRFANVDDETYSAGFDSNLVTTPRTPELTAAIMQKPIDFTNYLDKEPMKMPVSAFFTDEIVKLAAEGLKVK